MTIDLSPVVGATLSLCAVALTTFGTWAIARLARKLGIQANNAAVVAFDDALARSVHAGASALQQTIAAKGYDHPETKNAILAFAAPYAIDKFAPALKGIGLDPADPFTTGNYLREELDRIFPTAMTAIAASPVTPPSPPGTTAADLNRGELARITGAVVAIFAALSLGLSACAPGAMPPADPAVVAKINYVCAYSGAFKFADQWAASVVPVPGVSLGVNLLNAGVDQVCLHPDSVAQGEATVKQLIADFKAAGKM